MNKFIPLEEIPAWRDQLREAGKKLVVTNGVFDLMHRGHAEYLAQAAALGDVLLVLVNDDASVTALKGPTRPIQTQDDRAAMLAALECVGAVTVFKGPVAADALRLAAPDVYVKGGDYTPETLNRDEFSALQACGSQIKILPLVPGCSTSNIVKRILAEKHAGEASRKDMTLDEKLQPIFKRRSIRKFLPRDVEQHEVALLLEAAMAAPSAKACYPAEFIVLEDQVLRKQVSECLPNGSFLAQSPMGILVCGDLSRACGNELSYLIQDCSASVQNILLAASMLGLGACWLGVHPRQERMDALRALFKLPETIIPVACIALGWPSEEKLPRTNYEPEQVHMNAW
ncbi:MAG: nitroreductase family protein [Lentisphaeria bacterium]|nr:nitroreductase family protein [Lentisphaeria bacterium]